MNIGEIPTNNLTAVVTLLEGYVPGLTQYILIEALRQYEVRTFTVGNSKSDGLLTIKEAAERLKVSRRTIFSWIESGKLKTIHFSKRSVRIPASELVRFVNSPQ